MREASLLAEQLKTLYEASIVARAKLEEAMSNLTRSKGVLDVLTRFVAESEQGRQEALVDLERMKCCLDTETIRVSLYGIGDLILAKATQFSDATLA
ncbi:hypothetical protein QYF36_018439 [Acer negundo]|nr:hypothetical protein QYF36_018439 [Acer negundo]